MSRCVLYFWLWVWNDIGIANIGSKAGASENHFARKLFKWAWTMECTGAGFGNVLCCRGISRCWRLPSKSHILSSEAQSFKIIGTCKINGSVLGWQRLRFSVHPRRNINNSGNYLVWLGLWCCWHARRLHHCRTWL